MRIASLVFGLMVSVVPFVVVAGDDHDHNGHNHTHSHEPVAQPQAESIAAESVARLVASGKIDASWKGVAVAKAEQKTFGGQPEWVVSFTNPAVTDASKQTIYVFLTMTGEYLAANYTGK